MYKFVAKINLWDKVAFVGRTIVPAYAVGVTYLWDTHEEAEKAFKSVRRYYPEVPETSFTVELINLDSYPILKEQYTDGKRFVVCHSETVNPAESDYDLFDFFRVQDGAERAYAKYKLTPTRSSVQMFQIDKRGRWILIKSKKRGKNRFPAVFS